MGLGRLATAGTSAFLDRHRVANRRINKVRQGRPHVVDAIKNGQISLIINTPSGRRPRADESAIRINAVAHGIPLVTTATAAEAIAEGIAALRAGRPGARPIQEYHAEAKQRQALKYKIRLFRPFVASYSNRFPYQSPLRFPPLATPSCLGEV